MGSRLLAGGCVHVQDLVCNLALASRQPKMEINPNDPIAYRYLSMSCGFPNRLHESCLSFYGQPYRAWNPKFL